MRKGILIMIFILFIGCQYQEGSSKTNKASVTFDLGWEAEEEVELVCIPESMLTDDQKSYIASKEIVEALENTFEEEVE